MTPTILSGQNPTPNLAELPQLSARFFSVFVLFRCVWFVCLVFEMGFH